MPFYFAWLSDPPIPPFTLQTKGDIWSGKWVTTGTTWGGALQSNADMFGTGVIDDGAGAIENIRNPGGLVVGRVYSVTGSGIDGAEFTYSGGGAGLVSPKQPVPVENGTFTFSSDIGLDEIILDSIEFLENGVEYGITGTGIPVGTTFVYSGGTHITLNQECTATGEGVELTITSPIGRNIVKNLESTSGLVVGDAYRIFGIGLDNDVLGVFQDDGTILLSTDATETAKQTFLYIHRGTIYPDGGPFDPNIHARKDEYLFSIELEHNEGHFPSLKVGMKNPRVGMLSPGRNVWCWLSWHRTIGDPIIPLFHGRLTAVPSDLLQERITVSFVAEPNDYENQRNFVTADLKVPPRYDPVWFDNGNGTPETILEAYTRDWHTDRVTLEVSTSDILVGEDGTLEVNANEHLQGDIDIEISDKPTAAIYMTATAKWNQIAKGNLDLTRLLVAKFQESGSTKPYPFIVSYSGDGLMLDWPKPGTSINGGWSVGLDTNAAPAVQFKQYYESANFTTQMPVGNFSFADQMNKVQNPWLYWSALYPQKVLKVQFSADYEANRAWQERVSFFVEADLQAMSTDGSVETLSMETSVLDLPIDFDGSTPLKDPLTNTFFKTERGQQAFQFLLYYIIAKMAYKARAVFLTFTTTFDKVALAGLSCRWNAIVHNPRIPGGVATGKVTSYKLLASASGGMRAVVTTGCCIGRSGTPAEVVEGVGTYAAPGYMAPGYQAMSGATVAVVGNELTYQSFDDFRINDDGVNFYDMTPESMVKNLQVIAGPNLQLMSIAAIRAALESPLPDPDGTPVGAMAVARPRPDAADALKAAYTRVRLEMVPVDGSGFESQYVVTVSKLQLPKTIDLEAAS